MAFYSKYVLDKLAHFTVLGAKSKNIQFKRGGPGKGLPIGRVVSLKSTRAIRQQIIG